MRKPIPRFPPYEADDSGQIWGPGRWNGAHVMAQFHKGPYQYVSLWTAVGTRRHETVHRLVCLAFHGEPPFDGAQVRHLDGKHGNNLPGNLAWGTPQENAADMVAHGTSCRGEKNAAAKLSRDQVDAIRTRYLNGTTQEALAADFDVSQSQISVIVRGECWT